jgi:hypothetical protein
MTPFLFPQFVAAVEEGLTPGVFVWVIVPGGLIAGKLCSWNEIQALKSPGPGIPIENAKNWLNEELTKHNQAVAIHEAFVSTGLPPLQSFHILSPRFYIGEREIMPGVDYVEGSVSSVSAWGIGYPLDLRDDAAPPQNSRGGKRRSAQPAKT